MRKDEGEGEVALTTVLTELAEVMNSFSTEMEGIAHHGNKVARGTQRVLVVVTATLAICSIYILYLILTMAHDMGLITNYLQDMYVNFGNMSQNMQLITQKVGEMGESVASLSQISNDVGRMDDHLVGMVDSVVNIQQEVAKMKGDITLVNGSTHEMAFHFGNVSHAVDRMGYNVNEMAAPANMGPFSGMWPR